MTINCYCCTKMLFSKGAILITPPLFAHQSIDKIGVDNVDKLHICKECYNKVREYVENIRKKGK